MNKDVKGVLRGQCTVCSDCSGYDGGGKGLKCVICGHPPVKHAAAGADLSTAGTGGVTAGQQSQVIRDHLLTAADPSGLSTSPGGGRQLQASPRRPSQSPDDASAHPRFTVGEGSSRSQCRMPGCSRNAYSDLNTGDAYPVCAQHISDYLVHGLTSLHFDSDGTTPNRPKSSGPVSRHQTVQPPQGIAPQTSTSLDSDEDSQDAQPRSWLHSLLVASFRQQRPRTTTDGPATSPSPLFQAAVPTPNPMGSSQSTPALAPTPLPPQPMSPPTPLVPPDQQCRLPGCTKKKYVDPSGRVHDFCGRTHARQFTSGQSQVAPAMRCKTPGCPRQKRCKDDGTGYFDYCSISCRNSGQGSLGPSASVPEPGTTAENTCRLPNCNRRKYTDPANGRVHDYCCRSHAYEASKQGIVVTDTITITALSGQEFQRVSAIFTRTWAPGKGACPQLSFIFEIRNAGLKQRWTAYQGKLTVKTMEEYYHGTKLTCNITATKALCNDQNCGVCGISRGGLDRRCIRNNISFQRFGHGFYLAPNSSKCHDYTQGAQGFRAVLLCEVLPGKKYNLTKDDQSLTGPPAGFDSVYGKAGSNSVLNYDELVVYNPDCVMPRYVCVYQKDGTHKIAK